MFFKYLNLQISDYLNLGSIPNQTYPAKETGLFALAQALDSEAYNSAGPKRESSTQSHPRLNPEVTVLSPPPGPSSSGFKYLLPGMGRRLAPRRLSLLIGSSQFSPSLGSLPSLRLHPCKANDSIGSPSSSPAHTQGPSPTAAADSDVYSIA